MAERTWVPSQSLFTKEHPRARRLSLSGGFLRLGEGRGLACEPFSLASSWRRPTLLKRPFLLSLPPQHPVHVLPRSGGGHLPLRLAAHLHPCAATRHDRHRVLANALPHRAAHQLAAAAQGAAAGGGKLPVGERVGGRGCLRLCQQAGSGEQRDPTAL